MLGRVLRFPQTDYSLGTGETVDSISNSVDLY
jgi:hypothetical protein